MWWTGIAGYIKYAPNDKWYLATRGEWFHDHDGFETGTAQNLGEVTLTLQRMLASKIISGWNTVTTRLTRMFSHITRLTFAAIRTPSRSA